MTQKTNKKDRNVAALVPLRSTRWEMSLDWTTRKVTVQRVTRLGLHGPVVVPSIPGNISPHPSPLAPTALTAPTPCTPPTHVPSTRIHAYTHARTHARARVVVPKDSASPARGSPPPLTTEQQAREEYTTKEQHEQQEEEKEKRKR